jgi:ABC-type sugar transport system permease subunit
VLLLSVIGSFQAFELPYVLLNNSAGPDNRGLTIVMYLYQTGFLTGDLGYASAIGWVLALLLAGAAIVQLRLNRAEEK